ncbi:hypothetical protein F8M41_009989 [Gigaspora margarita]|uniref:Uncharacterized protein n=1 Tax=Gigaspora margarita TaxID=4874 RepID=A0A8H4A1C4_GIGMA|nr:hypothetical protein F8M41_009989 [Gigaspora margarita]
MHLDKAGYNISATRSWSWLLEEITVDNTNSLNMIVKWLVRKLNTLRSGGNITAVDYPSDNFSWLKAKEHVNKKLDTFWWLQHSTLSLEYRTHHLDPENNSDCLWYTKLRQTTKHFAIECTLSKEI